MGTNDSSPDANAADNSPGNVRKARPERTREALLDAFRELLLSNGYETMTVGAIVERAGVGRSTFYEHFEGKDDLFRASLTPIVAVLASATSARPDVAALARWLEHFWDNRALLKAILTGEARSLLTERLTDEIEHRLGRDLALRSPVPLRFVAAREAGAQLGLLEAWIAEGSPAAVASVVEALLRKI